MIGYPWKTAHLMGDRFSLFHALQDGIRHLIEQSAGRAHADHDKIERSLIVDLVEADDLIYVRAEVPGVSVNDIDISVCNGELVIKGEKKIGIESEKGTYIRWESFYGSFQRSISLPETADVNAARADLHNGVLLIEIPKRTEAVDKRKHIEMKSKV